MGDYGLRAWVRAEQRPVSSSLPLPVMCVRSQIASLGARLSLLVRSMRVEEVRCEDDCTVHRSSDLIHH